MTESAQVHVRRLMPADARLFREIRLEALQQAPEAFGSSFEQECSQSLAQFEAVLAHARERVELVQLTVVKENEAAQRLYRRCGFVAYGHEVHALKQDGRYYDEVLMAVALDPRN
jgi:hypothetical protein